MSLKYTIGSDPEFSVFVEGKYRDASSIFTCSTNSPIGTDGCSSTGELRPKAKTDPLSHANEIVKLIRTIDSDYICGKDITIHAGSYHGSHPIGGHIHYGFKPNDYMIGCLDTYVGVPLMLLEDGLASKFRRRNYGELGNYRDQPHGFEYRTPASWITDCGMISSSLCLAYVVGDFMRRNKTSKKNDLINVIHGLSDEFKKGDKKVFYDIMPQLFSDIRCMPMYKMYPLQINYLYHMITNRLTWRQERDVVARVLKNRSVKVIDTVKDNWTSYISANTNDYNLLSIIDKLKNKAIPHYIESSSPADSKVYIYGISDGHDMDVMVSVNKDGLSSVYPNLKIRGGSIGKGDAMVLSGYACIGMSRSLREDVDKAADVFYDFLCGIHNSGYYGALCRSRSVSASNGSNITLDTTNIYNSNTNRWI
jgi:hypothetical protein